MRKCIERAERKPILRIQKLSERTVPQHPGDVERVVSGKMQRAPHDHGKRTARGEDRHGFALLRIGEKGLQSAIHAGTEFLPRLGGYRPEIAVCPQRNYPGEQSLKVGALLLWIRGPMHGLVQFADPGVTGEKL